MDTLSRNNIAVRVISAESFSSAALGEKMRHIPMSKSITYHTSGPNSSYALYHTNGIKFEQIFGLERPGLVNPAMIVVDSNGGIEGFKSFRQDPPSLPGGTGNMRNVLLDDSRNPPANLKGRITDRACVRPAPSLIAEYVVANKVDQIPEHFVVGCNPWTFQR